MEIRRVTHQPTRVFLRGICWIIFCQKWFRDLWRSPKQDKPPSRIAVFASMELLGGGVMISAVIKTIRRLYPDAIIYLVGEHHRSGKLADFFTRHSWINEMIYCPMRQGSPLSEWWHFYRRLKSYQIDMCVLSPNHSCSNSVFLYLCGVPVIVGADLPHVWNWHRNIENRFLTRRLTTKQLGHKPYRQLDFPQAYARLFTGNLSLQLEELVPYVRFAGDPAENTAINKPVVTFYASSPGGPNIHQWRPDNFIALGQLLLKHYDVTIFLIGGPQEKNTAAEICEGIFAAFPASRLLNCCGAQLNETLGHIARSSLFVGNSGGVMQLAIATGVPVIGLLKQQDVCFSGPDAAGKKHVTLSREHVNDVPVAEVWQAVDLKLRWQNQDGLRHQAARGA